MILAANHLSYMDIFAVSLFADSAAPVSGVPGQVVPVHDPGARHDHHQARVSCRSTAARPTRRWCCKQAAELAARNNACVIFYPEATVTRDPEQWPMVAKTGVARLALEASIPVVPIAHWGAQRILPYGNVRAEVPAAQDSAGHGGAAS